MSHNNPLILCAWRPRCISGLNRSA